MRKSSNSCFSRSWKRGNLKKYLTRLSSIESQPKKVAVVVIVVVVVGLVVGVAVVIILCQRNLCLKYDQNWFNNKQCFVVVVVIVLVFCSF